MSLSKHEPVEGSLSKHEPVGRNTGLAAERTITPP